MRLSENAPLMATTRMEGNLRRTIERNWTPGMPGGLMSDRRTSGSSFSISDSAEDPSLTDRTVNPSSEKCCDKTARIEMSSSTIKSVFGMSNMCTSLGYRLWREDKPPVKIANGLYSLHRNIDRNSLAGIAPVEQVVAVAAVDDVHVVRFIPVIRPILRPGVNETEPIPTVQKAWISA